MRAGPRSSEDFVSVRKEEAGAEFNMAETSIRAGSVDCMREWFKRSQAKLNHWNKLWGWVEGLRGGKEDRGNRKEVSKREESERETSEKWRWSEAGRKKMKLSRMCWDRGWMFEAMAFKNSNKASWLLAALENGKSRLWVASPGASGARRGPVRPSSGAAFLCERELIYNG